MGWGRYYGISFDGADHKELIVYVMVITIGIQADNNNNKNNNNNI